MFWLFSQNIFSVKKMCLFIFHPLGIDSDYKMTHFSLHHLIKKRHDAAFHRATAHVMAIF